MKHEDLPEERLATTDEQGHRVFLYPADVSGKYKSRKAFVHGLLLVLFLVVPWLRIHGQPILLLDVVHRRFTFFGVTLWAHDAPLLVLVFLAIAITIAFVTSIWGRIWCGWACPQTVYTEAVFRRIEEWIEGRWFIRRRQDQGPWNLDKVLKKITKWSAYLFVAAIIGNCFLAYFVGTTELISMITRAPWDNPGAFGVMAFTTLVTAFDFGWFREQFCVIMCPYGRFQSVLMDDHSLSIIYDQKRGEPRREHVPAGQTEGDCVNCDRCVRVCPTGIDIRRGVQLECIACTACADACDEVMTRMNRKPGLIRYDSLAGLQGKQASHFSARSAIYVGALLLVLSGLSYALATRPPVEFNMVRGTGEAPYRTETLADGSNVVINHYTIATSNQTHQNLKLQLKIEKNELHPGMQLILPENPYPLVESQDYRIPLFFKVPQSLFQNGHHAVDIEIDAIDDQGKVLWTTEREVKLVGPLR